MPRTPPTTRASPSPASAAPCSISPPSPAPQSSSARWRRPSACASTTTARSKPPSPANGHRGTHVLARATSLTPKWTRNEWEAAFLKLLRDAGLPEPQTNEAFHAPGYGHCEPDYHWPEQRVIVETDGFETHGTRQAFRNDRAKDAALTAAGHRVLRFTRDDDPQLAIERVSAVLASSGRVQGFAR